MQNVVISIVEILDRIKAETGAKNDAEIARLLHVEPKKLAVWKVRNTIPYEELISFCREKGLDLEWILTGNRRPTVVAPSAECAGKDEVKKKIGQLLDAMDEEKKRDVLKYAEEKKLVMECLALLEGNKKR